MTRQIYLRTIIELYLAQPDTPTKAKRGDWAIAATFYQLKLPRFRGHPIIGGRGVHDAAETPSAVCP